MQLKAAMSHLGVSLSDEEVQKIMEKVDLDHNGVIDFDEVLFFCISMPLLFLMCDPCVWCAV